MKYIPETLLEIFMNGSLTPESQTAFDRLIKESPDFAEKVTGAMAERMGPAPSTSVDQITERLDAKFESLWVKNKPSKFAQFFRVSSKVGLILGAMVLAFYAVSLLWPRLMAALPQIDLSATREQAALQPKSVLAPPAMMAPGGSRVTFPTLSKPALAAPVKKIVAQPTSLPTIVPILSKPDYNVQTGNSIRLVMDNDKLQSVELTVLSPTGQLIRHLYQGSWSAGSHFVDWDGKDDMGALVKPGNYTVVVRGGGKTQSGTVLIQPNR